MTFIIYYILINMEANSLIEPASRFNLR